MLLPVNRSLYGIPESGLHWFKTYQGFQQESLGVVPSAHDLCLLYTRDGPTEDKDSKPAGIACLQTDDSLFLGNTEFQTL